MQLDLVGFALVTLINGCVFYSIGNSVGKNRNKNKKNSNHDELHDDLEYDFRSVTERKFSDICTSVLNSMNINLSDTYAKHVIPLSTYSEKDRVFLYKLGVREVYVKRNLCDTLNGYVKIVANAKTIREFYSYDIETKDLILDHDEFPPEEITFCSKTVDTNGFIILGFDTCHLCDIEKYGIDNRNGVTKMPLREAYEDMLKRAKTFALGNKTSSTI